MPEDKSPTQKILRRIRKFTAPKDRTQLRELLRNAAGAGLLDADALSMVEGVLDVSDLQVRDIMVPHNQMTCVRGDDLPQRILSVAIDSGHSRFPVLEPDGEKIIGILLVVTPLFFPVVMQVLGLLIGVIQAYIFAILAMVYIASATQAHEATEHKVTEKKA